MKTPQIWSDSTKNNSRWVYIPAIDDDIRITESGDIRITESDDTRIIDWTQNMIKSNTEWSDN